MKKFVPFLLVLSLVLAGCNASSYIDSAYAKHEEFSDKTNTNAKATIYRAFGSDVQTVVNDISKNHEPLSISKPDNERMFMVYDNSVVHVMKHPEIPGDSFIEVATPEFVRNNYDISLLEAYIIADIVEDVFEYKLKKKKKDEVYYSGYVGTGGKYYKSTGKLGSIRVGSAGSSSIRGGGPGSGK